MGSKNVLIDTHILLWLLSGSKRLKDLKWIHKFPFYFISPISILEIRFLEECGKIKINLDKVLEGIQSDDRFKIDDVSLERLCLQALSISWTRDPFDRLLVAHSTIQNIPLGTCDELIQEHYPRTVL